MGEIWPRIVAFCCRYSVPEGTEEIRLIPDAPRGLEIRPLACSGRLEPSEVLKAFNEGAEAVLVVGCQEGTCHNSAGSKRASMRVIQLKKILEELSISSDRIEFIFSPRLDAGPLIEAARALEVRLLAMGPLWEGGQGGRGLGG
ncbi:hydrogenase iron-sulfur subunit [Thermosulfuriphilus sp.]